MRAPEILPVAEPTVPRLARIIVVPVGIESKRNQGHIDRADVFGQIDEIVVVEIVEIIRGDPAALAVPACVAPGAIADTTMDVDPGIRRNSCNDRIIRSGAGAHVDVTPRVALRRECGCRRCDKED
jgi:hypothetical protein